MSQTHTQRLLERLRKIANPPTDYQLAKMLGVKRQHVHNWKKRGGGMDLTTAYTLADLLHEDRAIIAGMVELDRRDLSKEKRERLEHMLPRLVASTAFAFVACLAATITTSGRAQAESRHEGLVDVSREFVTPENIDGFTQLCIMRLKDAVKARLTGCLSWLRGLIRGASPAPFPA